MDFVVIVVVVQTIIWRWYYSGALSVELTEIATSHGLLEHSQYVFSINACNLDYYYRPSLTATTVTTVGTKVQRYVLWTLVQTQLGGAAQLSRGAHLKRLPSRLDTYIDSRAG